MRALIRKTFPDHGVLGEEFGSEGTDAEYVWVLDPIDGTKSFITGMVAWGTLIGLMRFGEPGYAKMAMDLRALPDGEGARLETETRIFLTDSAARRRFAPYWLVVRPFSGLIRRRWLRAAKRRAER